MSIRKIDAQKIEQAISDFEREVDFELVPVITDKSSFTEHIGWMISLLLLLLFLLSIDFFFQDSWASKNWYYGLAPFVAVIVGHLLDKSDGVDRFFFSKPERARQSYEKAQRVFFLKRLHEVKAKNSLILFVSVMERQIVILPDPRMNYEGVHQLQQQLLQLLQRDFGQKQFERGFLNAISFLKSELKAKFPRRSSDTENLVPNKLIWWKD